MSDLQEAEAPVYQFSHELAARFTARNYADEYLARRCRTTATVIQAWRAGTAVPTHAEWWYLERVAPEVAELGDLWRAARESTKPDDALRPATEFYSLGQFDDPAPGPATTAVTAVLPAQRPPILADQVGDAAAQALRRRLEPTRARTTEDDPGRVIPVPREFVVYRCRITRGRILELPLPVDLSQADVDRLCAFLRTQADDEEPGASGRPR